MNKSAKTTERGWPAHFIMADRCLFHRNTLIELKNVKIVVSTVGLCIEGFDYNGHHTFTTIGHDRYYETMVFFAKNDEFHDADASQQLDFDCPDKPLVLDEINANNIHDRMVYKWKSKIMDLNNNKTNHNEHNH